ncbi:hypothetical protein GCM10009841_33160 [Microlunatus panaciterrae]|uniref:Uncharacterized protein n=1 Tax=Microlunatus panaciterrae TaxID=400768 RepID=A0ABS2RJ26_9ACTN|nr:hypothetical protein [Microlunatus panaciterrae]MBM7797974.1 hypothetical protein [Microlunatus panaciterrae]
MAVPTGTELTLQHTVAQPDDAASTAAGWHLCLAVAEELLGGRQVGPIIGRAALDHGWQQLRDEYQTNLDSRR